MYIIFPLFRTSLIAISLSPSRIIKNVQTKCIIFDEALRIRVKKLKQNLSENYSKITAYKFSKREHAPRPPESLFCFSISFKLVLPKKKNTLEKNYVAIMSPYPLLLKFLATPLSAVYQHFSNEGSNFRSNLQKKTPRIVTQSFLYTFLCFLQNIFEKTLAKA